MKCEKTFFKSLVTAIVKEENELNELYRNSNKEYQKFAPAGVSCLFETTFVYITIKQLLKDKFPLVVSWEHPYPNNKSLKADMALLNSCDTNDINSLIEFKIWKTEDGKEIKEDIDKLNTVVGYAKYMVIIEYTDNKITDNKAFLDKLIKEKNPKFNIIDCNENYPIKTLYLETENYPHIVEKPVNIYLAKVN